MYLFNGIQKPDVIITDRELALMNALSIIFSDLKNLLCVWHISKNILKNCKVSTYALKKINEQYQRVKLVTLQEPLLLCSRSFSKTMELPSSEIKEDVSYSEDPFLLQNLQQRYQE
ncbi:8698_t:CDS:2 [Scutellospora calospora]|uniref:8698_t:CDS:1 n=1 Tax=Scutellospora calospora TaxID=85575 RepID=A0ACA9K4H8_9GLOM|nr:8698_t:CDS:2 [Scutellospora calospora]